MESPEIVTRTTWTIDPAHSEIGFKVKHLVFANVRGNFKEFNATVHTSGNDFTSAEIAVSINARSVDTGNDNRDKHLRSADFFNAEEFKEISFSSRQLLASGRDDHYILNGDLTMRGVKKPIVLDVEFGGIIKDPWGAEKALFNISGKINRKEWGFNYNSVLETGGLLISEDVWINCEVQLIKQS